MKRHFLFLQGVASPLFARLADHLAAAGHGVGKIHFCAGDALHWGRRPCRHYRGELEGLEHYYRQQFSEHAFTDVVLFGDRRPVHRPAVRLAASVGSRVHVFEEGYVRPNWVTLERGGVNGDSPLPRDPDWYREVAPHIPRPIAEAAVRSDIRVRAAHDMLYHAANALNPLRYPGYRTHRPHRAPVEYAGWIRRYSTLPFRRRSEQRRTAALLVRGNPYYLLPLQLNGDTQITQHSPYADMTGAIDAVMRSFARHAAPEDCLVIKNHPLDTGLVAYSRRIDRLAADLGIAGRILYLESGDLAQLIRGAQGVVTINSTVGMTALALGCPTFALGTAIYDLPGLTVQGRLEGFWRQPVAPDRALFEDFRDTVLYTTQINGDLYTGAGIARVLRGCDRLLEEISPLEALLQQVSPNSPVSTPVPAMGLER